jgi:hypothetical protein
LNDAIERKPVVLLARTRTFILEKLDELVEACSKDCSQDRAKPVYLVVCDKFPQDD